MSQPPRRSVAGALRSLRLVPALLAASLCLAGCNWLQFAGSSSHQGNNSSESTLTTANVSGLHQLFQTTLPSTADGAPAFVENVSTPGGTRNLLFVTTRRASSRTSRPPKRRRFCRRCSPSLRASMMR